MAPPSLGALCRKTVVANIDELTYVSYLPYERVRSLLSHVRDGKQLQGIEEMSPQIQAYSDELWEAFTKKKFPVQLKKRRKLNNDLPLDIISWRDLYWELRKEDDEQEAHALALLEKTLTTFNKTKDLVKANLADPRRLPKRPKDTGHSAPFAFYACTDRSFSNGNHAKDSLVQKVRKEADRVANNRQLAIKKRLTPTLPLSTVPKGLPEAMRSRRQPLIPTRIEKDKAVRMDKEHEERQQREARLLAAQKSKAKNVDDDSHLPGPDSPPNLQAKHASAPKPASNANSLGSSSKPMPHTVKRSSSNFLACPPTIQKAQSRMKVGTSNPPRPVASSSTSRPKIKPDSSLGLARSASPPSATSAKSSAESDSNDDLFGEKGTPNEPKAAVTPSSPSKRPISMISGSADNTNSTDTNSTATNSAEAQPLRKKKKTAGIFMPAKRAR